MSDNKLEQREDPAYHAYMECMATEVKPRDEQIKQLKRDFKNTTDAGKLLCKELDKLKSELAKYKSCAVEDGEGNPIGIGETRFYMCRESQTMKSFKVNSITKAHDGYIIGDVITQWLVRANYCYSTAEAVPQQDSI